MKKILTIPSELQELVKLPARPTNLDPRGHRQYRNALKETLFPFEQKNHEYIVFYRSNDVFWMAGDHSALLYTYYLIPKLKWDTPRLSADGDFTAKKWCRQVSIRIRGDTINKFKEQGLTLLANSPEIIIFGIADATIELETIASWLDTEKGKLRTFESQVMPSNVFPQFYATIGVVFRELVDWFGNLKGSKRVAYGRDGLNEIKWVMYNYALMANDIIDRTEYFHNATGCLERLRGWLIAMLRINAMDTDRASRISQKVLELRNMSIAAEAKLQQRDKDAQQKRAKNSKKTVKG